MLLAMTNMLFVLAEAEVASPAIPVTVSVGASILLFVLVRIAMHLYSSQDILIMGKRLVDLDTTIVRLSLSVENLQKKEKKLKSLQLAVKDGKNLKTIATLYCAPIQRHGDRSFIGYDDSGFFLDMKAGSANEAVIEFHLKSPCSRAYLMGVDAKGRLVKARIDLVTTETQMLSFHRA